MKPATMTDGKLHLFSLYADFPASVRSRQMAAMIARMAGPRWQTSSEMWTVDNLKASEPIRQMITNEAANADVIIVAVSSPAHIEPALANWLDSFAAAKTNRPSSGLLIGLPGDGETQAAESKGLVKLLIRSAQQSGRDFVWRKHAQDEAGWLAKNIENLLENKLTVDNEATAQYMAS